VQNFTGGDTISVVNSQLMKRALLTVMVLAGLGLTARADFDPIFGFYRPELFSTVDSTTLVRDLPMRDFLDGRLPGSTSLGRMGSARSVDFEMTPTSSPANAAPRHKANVIVGPIQDPKDGKDYSSVESLAVEKASLSWTGGEIGIFYGHSASGHYNGDEFGSYILGGVGNDHMQINVGAGYEESHFSRSRH
jgi:hypothetical protein